ncbi:hypothetical protein L1987_84941 [Smallanthus sonchifolius]|uniref:Uncharacterized protein n=1 Tax=Smallanthus sonchifolius TaxID=185202 RepID=A0ACB8XVZ2_9ASTR|nr:hypothetical protein L1987_84941 [Smallanthus sonchifolius]
MPPFEALYGRKCRTLVCWGEIGQRELGFGSHNTFLTSSNQIASLRTVRDLLTRKEKLRCSPSQVQGSGGFSYVQMIGFWAMY